jgi:hypothetical protein
MFFILSFSALETFALCNGFQVSSLFILTLVSPVFQFLFISFAGFYDCKYIILLDIYIYVSSNTHFLHHYELYTYFSVHI